MKMFYSMLRIELQLAEATVGGSNRDETLGESQWTKLSNQSGLTSTLVSEPCQENLDTESWDRAGKGASLTSGIFPLLRPQH